MDLDTVNAQYESEMTRRRRERDKFFQLRKSNPLCLKQVNWEIEENKPISDRRLYAHFSKRWTVLNGNKQHLGEKYKDGAWKKEPCYIIAGGPSVNQYKRRLFDNFLKDKKVIGINRAFQFFDNIDINLAADYKLYKWMVETPGEGLNKVFWAKKEKGIDFCFVDLINGTMNDVYYIKNIGREGLGATIKEGLFCYSNTGYAAINLAYCLGANPIFLIGYDMKLTDDDRHHYHDYPTGNDYKKTLRGFNKGLERLFPRIKRKVQIYNLSKDTAINCFLYRKIWEHYELDEYNFIYEDQLLQTEFMKDNPEFDRPMMCFISKEELKELEFDSIEELRNFNDEHIDKERLFFLRRAN